MLICLFKKTSTDLEGVGVRTPPSWKIQTCLIHIEIIPKINIPLLEKILIRASKGSIFVLGFIVCVRKLRLTMILYGKKIACLVVFLKIHLQVVYTTAWTLNVISYFALQNAAVEIYRLCSAFFCRI